MLKINIELIKHENAYATTRPIGFQIFENLRKNEEFQDFMFFFVFLGKLIFFWRGTLRVLHAETRLTVYRTMYIRKQWLSPADQDPHKMVIHHPEMIELAMFCIMKYMKSQRKCCRAYIEDQRRANQIGNWQCHDQAYDIPIFLKIP